MNTSKKRVLFYLLDGARPDVLTQLIAEGRLPHIKQLVDEGTFKIATTCFPSTTGPAYLPFLTGHFPGTLNIPGIRWFDKKEFKRTRWNKMAMRSYCGPEAGWFNTDMPANKPTLFELTGSAYNLYNMITRNVPDEHDLGKKGKNLLYTRAHFFKRHHPVDLQGHERIMELLKSNKDFDFLFAVFPSVDWDSHYHDIRDAQTFEAYEIADNSIGEVRAYLEQKGWWKDILFMLTSDHGLTPTHTHFDLGDWLTDQGLKSISYPVIWRSNPKSAVMISGNSFGSIHLLNHKGDQVLAQKEILKYLGVERLKALLETEAVDFIAYRGDNPFEYYVENRRGRALITCNNNQYGYWPVSADPFDFGIIADGYMETLEATIQSNYPDALVQIVQLFRSNRAGDIIVSARNGYDLRDFWEYPEHKGSHGSLSKEHMLVPLIYNQKGWAGRASRTADIFPTILKWMNKTAIACEGVALN
ncbi:alkaline phosphatase family protein [Pedobacter sp. L105]|uniref:alkaline phosphatase family protein n=1 Tax=Pedobacter sp. L105 TaxID=1641871 RepID=UPI00131AD96B|nr:alkaline phosphatase family protein [Pedobacter sp. L105]